MVSPVGCGRISADTILIGSPRTCERRRCPDQVSGGNFRSMKTRSAKRHAQSAGDCHGWHAWPRRRRWIRSGAALLFFPGCGGGETPAKDTETKAPETVATESTLAAMPAPGGTCPAYGLW